MGHEIRQRITLPGPDVERACISLLEEINRVLTNGGQAQDDLLLTALADALQAAVSAYEQHGMHVPPELVKSTTVTFEHQLGPVQTVLPIHSPRSTWTRCPRPPDRASTQRPDSPEAR
ncbi:hypothetical protein [Actinoplanes sp. NPDC020271]|uniref:hypothetical protein n=1 Tax=Actinoplanes sp. NPDC020271 TaxID=3363896 RepID=UPI0037BCEDE3